MTRLKFSILMLASALAVTPALAQGSAPPTPDLSPGGKTVFLPYLNAPLSGAPLLHTPKLAISVNGGRPVRGVMDTGSTGIVLAARLIPNLSTLPVIKQGELTYSSSGRIMKGVWVKVPVTISGTNGAQITTRPVPVLAVTRVDCTPTARHCRPRQNPTGIAMMGIGFARGGQATHAGLGDHNAFLSLPEMGSGDTPGTMRRGYLVTQRGVYLGLSAEAGKGMTFIKLDKAADRPGWSPIPACLSLGGRQPAACGTALIDTGVTSMYLTLPDSQLAGQTAPNKKNLPTPIPGTTLGIAFGPNGTGPSYSFKAADKSDPAAPDGITLVNRPGRVFVNTSVRLLNRFDYLYDAEQGFAGFRPVAKP